MPSGIRNLIKGSSIYTLGNFLSRGLSIVSMPIMTRYLVPGEYGILSMTNVIVAILSTFFSLGTAGFIVRYYFDFQEEEKRKRFFGGVFVFLVGTGLIFSLLLIFSGESTFQYFFRELPFKPYVLIGIGTCFWGIVQILPEAFLLAREQALFLTAINLAKSIVGLSLTLFLVVVLRMGALGPIVSSFAVSVLVGFYFLYFLRKEIVLNLDLKTVKKCIAFSLPILVLLLGKIFTGNMETLILQKYTPLSTVGVYSIAASIASVLIMVGVSFDAAWTPFFYSTGKNQSEDKAKEVFSYLGTYICLIYMIIGLVFTIFRHEMIQILAPRSYYGAIKIVPYVVIGGLLNVLSYVPLRGILFQKRTNYLFIITFCGMSLSCGLNLLFVPRYEMFGAALASLVTNAIILAVTYSISQRIYPITYQYTRLIHLSIVFLLIVWVSTLDVRELSAIAVITRSGLLGMFLGVLFGTKFFEKREIEKVKEALLRRFNWGMAAH